MTTTRQARHRRENMSKFHVYVKNGSDWDYHCTTARMDEAYDIGFTRFVEGQFLIEPEVDDEE